MQFNPLTQDLFTNEGAFLKRLECRHRIDWEQLASAPDGRFRTCQQCQDPVYDTARLSDGEVADLIGTNPDCCFRVHLNQPNLTITTQRHVEPEP